MKIPTQVLVALPNGPEISGTYTGNGDPFTTLAWVRMVEGDSSSKILVPFSWLTEVKPPLPAEPISQNAIVVVRHADGDGAYPYRHAGHSWINVAGQRLAWAEICERDKDGDPVQVWPPASLNGPRPTDQIEFRAHSGTYRTSVTWPRDDTPGHQHIVTMAADAATDLERLINP